MLFYHTDVRLRKLAEERNELLDQIRHLKLELEDERSRHRNGPRTLNGPQDSDMEDLQSKFFFSRVFFCFF